MTLEKTPLEELIAKAASDKKARNIVVMDVEGISPVTDTFIICSASSTTQVQAISNNIEKVLGEHGNTLFHCEGYREGRWILLDYGICVAHIFVEEDRQFYNIEKLWADAKSYVYEA